eukprot:293898-Amphidinium_carterae.1
MVLTAVKESGFALQYAAEECKANREIVLAAVQQNPRAIQFAADEPVSYTHLRAHETEADL